MIDLSFYSIEQISVFCDLRVETAIETIDTGALRFLEDAVERTMAPNMFQIAMVLRRIESKLSEDSKLKLFHSWLGVKPFYKQLLDSNVAHRDWLMKQSLRLIMWLLHLKQFGLCVEKYTKTHYFYLLYIENSEDNLISIF